ncbi:hypothetical protein C1645_835889 [Glomus cerebriforme]|uniref:F-box domain-containing protein n=1 Tax=Glomus cerebriforme TaxID=658196 RepID=A0A397SHZ5_9GLOM|nr:hypothetical protein C1645_835889 [Glomus cerebriforme]
MAQLPVDCLNEILEYLEDDKTTLQSCLLVNHLWCEISFRIFWRNGFKFRISNFRTLIVCLPNESKEILHKNEIIISTPTSKSPMFNYASFCRVLSLNRVYYKLEQLLKNQQTISFQNLSNNTNIVTQEFLSEKDFENFERLQHTIFPLLQILIIKNYLQNYELLTKFLENNGKNLRELFVNCYVNYSDNTLNLAIAVFCPNLRKLSVGFKNGELETLKIVFNSCHYLESIKIWCGGEFLSDKEALEACVNYSQKNFYEIILFYQHYEQSELLPEELESFFIRWI